MWNGKSYRTCKGRRFRTHLRDVFNVPRAVEVQGCIEKVGYDHEGVLTDDQHYKCDFIKY